MHKDRVKKAIAHEGTEIVPYHFSFTIPASKKLTDYYGKENFEPLSRDPMIYLSIC